MGPVGVKRVGGNQRPQALLDMLPPWHCAPLPPSLPTSLFPLAQQLQDLAEFPGSRWRFYRLRVDRPEGNTESSGVRRSLQPG